VLCSAQPQSPSTPLPPSGTATLSFISLTFRDVRLGTPGTPTAPLPLNISLGTNARLVLKDVVLAVDGCAELLRHVEEVCAGLSGTFPSLGRVTEFGELEVRARTLVVGRDGLAG